MSVWKAARNGAYICTQEVSKVLGLRGFAIFREIFTEWGFSATLLSKLLHALHVATPGVTCRCFNYPGLSAQVIVEYNKLEVDRDCFQYICGICWCAMSDADNIVSKAHLARAMKKPGA